MKDWKKLYGFCCWRWSYALALLPAEWEVVKVKEKITIPPGVIEDTDYDFTDDNPAEQLGYDSIEDMRTQEHEIISSDDNDNTVAEGYWYPDGDRSSSLYLWSREIPFTGMNLTRSRGIFKRENRMALYSS